MAISTAAGTASRLAATVRNTFATMSSSAAEGCDNDANTNLLQRRD